MRKSDQNGVIEEIDPRSGDVIEVRALVSLSENESRKKRRCEILINAGRKHFMRTGRALARVDRLRLYKDEFRSFDEYVQTKWHLTPGRAYQMIRAVNLCTTVSIRIPNERVARAVLHLPAEDRGPVLLLAHAASGGDLDTGWIKSAAETHSEIRATGGQVSTEDGGMVEATASVIANRAERLGRQRQHVQDGQKAKAEKQGLHEVFKGRCTLHSVSGKIDAFTVIAANRDDLVNLKGVKPGSRLWIVVYEVPDEKGAKP